MEKTFKKVYTMQELVALDQRWRLFIIMCSENETYEPNKIREKLHSYIIDKLTKDDFSSVRLNAIFNIHELIQIYDIRFSLKLK